MYKIAVHILKGGCGKTTLSGNLSFGLKKENKNVLLIDCDIQANATSWLIGKYTGKELGDVLYGECTIADSVVNISDNLSILPTKTSNSQLKSYAETKLFQEPFIFEDLLQEVDKMQFDYVIFDLSPSISQLERCVLLSVNEVIMPLSPEFFSYEGINLFTQEITKINHSYRKNIQHNKIIVNLFNQSFRTHRVYMEAIKKLQDYRIYYVPQDRKIADSQIHHQTIFEYYPRSKTIEPLTRIVKEIIHANQKE